MARGGQVSPAAARALQPAGGALMDAASASGGEEERHRAAHRVHAAVHQTGSAHHHRVPGAGLRVRQRHPGAHHLRLRRPGDDGDGKVAAGPPLCCHGDQSVSAPPATPAGEAVAGRGVCDPGAECGAELHRVQRRQARRDKGAAHQVRQGSSAEGDAAARRRQRLLRDQEGLLPGVSPPRSHTRTRV